jgi:endonuclease-3
MPDRKPSKARSDAQKRDRSAPPVPGSQVARTEPLPPEAVSEIFRRFAAADPDPRGELEHVDPYTLLVAVVLSAQATDKSVNLATKELYKVADTPAKMVALGEERLTDYIRAIGLFRSKARNVIALSRRLLDEHDGIVPPARAVLQGLPGVGPKSASVVLNIAFNEPTIAVDTHVFRVSNRLPLVIAQTPEAVQLGLEALVPREFLANAHHWLILHGRYICKARAPECPRCLVNDICRFPTKTEAAPSS